MAGKIVVAGGTGALGTALLDYFSKKEYEVVVLTRQHRVDNENVRFVHWDAKTLGTWVTELEGSVAVINLVGKSVNCRYTKKNKTKIIYSRVDATTVIGEAICQVVRPPGVWINAGSIAIFGNTGSAVKTEASFVGYGFSPDVCKAWEAAFYQTETLGTRKVFLRLAVVLQSIGGILKPFVRLAQLGFGGKIGSGKQYVSWIHEFDFVRMVDWLIQNPEVEGTIHACSPNPVTNRMFMRAIRFVFGIPIGLPNFGWAVRMGAWLIGTEAELVLSGRAVVSQVLKNKDFRFNFTHIAEALSDIKLTQQKHRK